MNYYQSGSYGVLNNTSGEQIASPMYNNFHNEASQYQYSVSTNVPFHQPPPFTMPSADPRLNYFTPNIRELTAPPVRELPAAPVRGLSASPVRELPAPPVPNLPAPPVRDSSVVEQLNKKSDDELWIETWLSKIGKIDINLDSTSVKPITFSKAPVMENIPIHNAKTSLIKCLSILGKLSQTQEDLKRNVDTMSSSEWKRKTIEIGGLKDDFTQSIGKFSTTEVVTSLRKAIEKRRRKRLAQKKRKLLKKEQYIAETEKIKKADKDADMWLESMKDKVERAKMEEHFKKDADCILAEVTKKKNDARKQLSLVQALVKLRTVRQQAAVQRGEKVSLEDAQAFERVTSKLITMWQDVLKTYMKEEQGLRLMLKQTASEDCKAAQTAKENSIVNEWHTVFFGPKYTVSPDNHIFWALTAAERDMETFIAIRRSWDTFLVPFDDLLGSNIPIGWVLPEPGSERWNKYLRQ